MADESGSNKQLNAALLEAQKAVHAVTKDAVNQHHRYGYASSEAIIIEARQCLTEAGLVVRRGHWSYDPTNNKVYMDFHITHPDSGEYFKEGVEFPAVPGNGRPLDKALAAALTTAQSYYLRDLLLIPRVDVEMDTRDDSRPQKPSQPVQPAPQAAAKQATDIQILEIKDMLVTTNSREAEFMHHLGIKDMQKMTEAQYKTGLGLLKRKQAIQEKDGPRGQ